MLMNFMSLCFRFHLEDMPSKNDLTEWFTTLVLNNPNETNNYEQEI